MPDDRFETPTGVLTLRRPGQDERSPLQAWDAADSYALAHLVAGSDDEPADADGAGGVAAPAQDGDWLRCLVVNDAFGAVALALARAGESARPGAAGGRRIWSWSDSAVAHDALAANAAANDIDAVAVVPVTELGGTEAALGVDLVVVKVPKSLALLEHQLCELSAVVGSGTTVVGAGMTRHIHTSTIELFERILGPSRTTLARRKARLILTDVATDLEPTASPYPSPFVVDADTVADGTGEGLTVWNLAGVFSQRRLDIGTRFLLESLPPLEGPLQVVDLGCGNGVVGAVVARRNPQVTVAFVDESAAAIASAQLTWNAAVGDAAHPPAAFVRADAGVGSVDGIDDGSVDVVVLNPPFHDQQAVAVAAGRSLIAAAHRMLAPGGRLIVVANRHLGHHVTMRRLFGSSDVIASNAKFVVMGATRR